MPAPFANQCSEPMRFCPPILPEIWPCHGTYGRRLLQRPSVIDVQSAQMDGSLLDITVFLLATFAGALIVGATGFAFGLVAAAMWLHVLTPVQTATLIIAFGLILQGYSVFRLRHALDWRRLWPFVLGAALGVPAGVGVLGWADPPHVRAAPGAVLILYSVHPPRRPPLEPIAP